MQIKELRFKESQKQRRRRAREAVNNIMPYNASLIAPAPLGQQKRMSGQEMRRMAASDREEVGEKVRKVILIISVANDA